MSYCDAKHTAVCDASALMRVGPKVRFRIRLFLVRKSVEKNKL